MPEGMRPDFYTRICKGKLEPVLKVIEAVAASPAHLEITNLIIPGLNDTDDDFHKLGRFISGLDDRIVLHLSAYHPSYKMNNPQTPVGTIENAYQIVRQYLKHVYVGNLEIKDFSHSFCHKCGQTLIERTWYNVEITGLTGSGNCTACGTKSDIILRPKSELKMESS